MAKRNEHLFQFTGKQIGDAADEEFGYHHDRVIWWKTEQQKAIDKAKAAGVEVREYEMTGGKNVQVVLDPSISSRLTECANKINSHRAAADRFKIEAACYGTQAERSYELHPDDVVYFRLAGGQRED
jgi:hypothetical protein